MMFSGDQSEDWRGNDEAVNPKRTAIRGGLNPGNRTAQNRRRGADRHSDFGFGLSFVTVQLWNAPAALDFYLRRSSSYLEPVARQPANRPVTVIWTAGNMV
jgi:hypothetical protein